MSKSKSVPPKSLTSSSKWFVYIVLCSKDDTLYTGITNDLARRLQQHNTGAGARYTRGRGPIILLKYFGCRSKSEALKLEHRIKKLSRDQKLKLWRGYITDEQFKKDLIMKDKFTALAVVLDSSGSMARLTQDTIGSFNQFLTEQQAVPGEAVFSLCTFNSDYHLVHDFVPLASVSQLTAQTYWATGGTALLDAMGTTIDTLGTKLAAMSEEERPSKVIVLVITDGEENSSHRYTLEQIKTKVTHQQDIYNWNFVFMGANIDAIGAGTSLGVSVANSMQYDASSFGTRSLYSSVSPNMSSYRLSNSVGQVDFFNQPAVDVDDIAPTSTTTASPTGEVKPVNIKSFDPGHPLPSKK